MGWGKISDYIWTRSPDRHLSKYEAVNGYIKMTTTLNPSSSLSGSPFSSAVVLTTVSDNAILYSGGLIAALRKENVTVCLLPASSNGCGLAGSKDTLIRMEAYRQAMQILGVDGSQKTVFPLNFDEQTISRVMVAIEAAGADLVLAPNFDQADPDECTLAWLAIEATRRLSKANSSLRLALYGMEPSFHPGSMRIAIEPWLNAKIEALDCLHHLGAPRGLDGEPLASKKKWLSAKGSGVGDTEFFRVLDGHRLAQPVLLIWESLPSGDCLPSTNREDGLGRVAVLIRSLDRDTLLRALDSVALQTYPNIDVHVLNVTGQAHRTVSEQAGRFRINFHDPGVRVLRSAAANQLLDHASGDFALFLDDDDWLAPDHVSRLVSALESHPNAVGAYSGVEHGVLESNEWKPEVVFSSEFDRHRLLFENYLPIHSVLFRLSLAKNLDGDQSACRFDETLDLYEDWDFWNQLILQGPLVHINAVSAYYLRHPIGNSGAFDDGEVQREFRHKLLRKWSGLLSANEHVEFLNYVQSIYRAKATLEERVAELDDRFTRTDCYNHGLEVLLSAREVEIENARQHLASTESILNAREEELENTRQHLDAAEAIIAARETELQTNAASLDDLRKHAKGLSEIVLSRETELRNIHAHANALTEIVAERDRELTELRKPFWSRKKHV